jgi:hypothetical protein
VKRVCILLAHAFFCCVFLNAVEPPKDLVEKLKSSENYKNLYFAMGGKDLIEANDAINYFVGLAAYMKKDAFLTKNRKLYRQFCPAFKIQLKDGSEYRMNFTYVLKSAFCISAKEVYQYQLVPEYDMKILLVSLKRVNEVIGAKDSPPELPEWFALELKAFLKNYFKNLNRSSGIIEKRLAYFFESMDRNKRLRDYYYYLQGRDEKNKEYIRRLIEFLKSRKGKLTFSDYAGIVYPICNNSSSAPQYCEYPEACPDKIINILSSLNNVKKIELGLRGRKTHIIKGARDLMMKISNTMTLDLEPDQMPQTRGIAYVPEIICAIEMNNGNKYDIGLTYGKLLKAWSFYNPKQKRWIFYHVAKGKDFDQLYETLKSLIDHEEKATEKKN